MFYAHFVLAKKGPMARIWLAAHWDKKLTRAHVYETNIEKSVDGILQPKVKMALRTTGHLLLGVVRIYSRKAKYLLADCNEAFSKMKVVFRPGMIDLPEDRHEAAPHVINLPGGGIYSDVKKGKYQLTRATKLEDITLREDLGMIHLDFEEGFGEIPNVVVPDCDDEMEDSDDEMDEDEEDEEDLSVLREPEEPELEHEPSLLMTELPKLRRSSRHNKSREVSSMLRSGIDDNLFEDFGFGDLTRPTRDQSISLKSPRLDASKRVLYNPSTTGPGSLAGQSGYSRPTTPFELEMPPPSIDESLRSLPLPSRPASSIVRSDVANMSDNTTLLKDTNESFALDPVDASAIRGSRRKRKRRLVVDNVKAFSADYMKNQMFDASDLLVPLDLAPPTKRLVLMKEIGTTEKLFTLPGNYHYTSCLLKNFNYAAILPFETAEMFGLLGESEGDNLALSFHNDNSSSIISRPKGVKRKADTQLLPEDESVANKENCPTVEEPSEIQNQSLHPRQGLGGLTPLHSQSLGNMASPHRPEAVTPSSKLAPKTPTYAPSVTLQTNEDLEMDFGVDNFDLGGPDETYDPPVENASDSIPIIPATPTRLNSFATYRESMQLKSIAEDETRGDDPNVQSRRATRLHKDLRNIFASNPSRHLFSKLASSSTRKQAAQKFYSVLILQKAQAIAVDQADGDEDIFISKGLRFENAVY